MHPRLLRRSKLSVHSNSGHTSSSARSESFVPSFEPRPHLWKPIIVTAICPFIRTGPASIQMVL